MPNSAALQAQLAQEVSGRILPHGPVVKCDDPEFDPTVVDFSDPECLTLTQLDEHGVNHTVLISPVMAAQLRQHLLKWITSNCN